RNMSSIAVGFMSGTSCDGVDVAVLETDGKSAISVLAGHTLPYDEGLRTRLLDASQHDVPITELARLEKDMSLHHVAALRTVLERDPPLSERIDVLGFHGHTVRHVPNEGITMQIGNPWL